MIELFHSHWLNKKFKLDKLSITWLWVLVTNYQRYMAFCPSYNLTKIKRKIKLRSTYLKTLNSEARLRNKKVLDIHSTQTESGFLESHDQFTPLCMIWMICCTRFWNPDRTIQSDWENLEPLIFTFLLTLKTSLYEKCMKPLKPRSNRTILRTMASFRGSHGSILLLYLARKLISIHKEFDYKKYKNKLPERKRKQRAGLTA